MNLVFLSYFIGCCIVLSDALLSERRLNRKEMESSRSLIVGGGEAEDSDYPFRTEIFTQGLACGGVLIHPDVVLTSAHCLRLYEFIDPDILQSAGFATYVNVGGHDDILGNVYVITGFWIHPKYGLPPRLGEYDYALLKLDGTVEDADLVTRAEDGPSVADRLTVIGQGLVGSPGAHGLGSRPSDDLKEATIKNEGIDVCNSEIAFQFLPQLIQYDPFTLLPVFGPTGPVYVKDDDGQVASGYAPLWKTDPITGEISIYGPFTYDEDVSLCATGVDGMACFGDSGGAVLNSGDELVGIVSGGVYTSSTTNENACDPDSLLRVALITSSEISDWLDETICSISQVPKKECYRCKKQDDFACPADGDLVAVCRNGKTECVNERQSGKIITSVYGSHCGHCGSSNVGNKVCLPKKSPCGSHLDCCSRTCNLRETMPKTKKGMYSKAKKDNAKGRNLRSAINYDQSSRRTLGKKDTEKGGKKGDVYKSPGTCA